MAFNSKSATPDPTAPVADDSTPVVSGATVRTNKMHPELIAFFRKVASRADATQEAKEVLRKLTTDDVE